METPMQEQPPPTPAEIETRSAEVREHWSEAEHERRRRGIIQDRSRARVSPEVAATANVYLKVALQRRRGE